MASIQATRVKKGMLVKMGEDLFRILEFQHVTPGNLRGFVRVKMRNIRSGTLSDQKLRSEDFVERATLDEKNMQYMYSSGDDYYFMDTETYDQFAISGAMIGDDARFLLENTDVFVSTHDGEVLGVDLPVTVDLRVSQTDPGFAGDTATGAKKAATLETGLVVQVPLFVNEGDTLRIDTRTGEYVTRVQ